MYRYTVSAHKKRDLDNKLSTWIICSADVCWLCLSSCAALSSHSQSEMDSLCCAAQRSVLGGACHLLYSSLNIYRCLGRSLKWQTESFAKKKMLEGIDVARGYLRQCCKVPEGVQQEETTGHSRKLPQPSVCSENLGDIWDRFSPWDASQSLPCTSPSSSQLAVAAGNSMTWRVGGWWTVEVQCCAGKASPQSFDGCQS